MNNLIWGGRSWVAKAVMLISLGAATLFCIVLGFHLREYTGRELYRFLNWDIFLAWVPVIFTLLLDAAFRAFRYRRIFWPGKLLIGLLGLGWLLFYPNAAYLVTDLIHPFVHYHPQGRFVKDIEFWYHLFLFFTSAMVGLGLAAYALSSVQQRIAERYGNVFSWIFAAIILILSSLGIYIGRFIRWNSWDVFTDPHKIVRDIVFIATQPSELHFMLLFTGMMLIISTVSYLIMRGGLYMIQR